jgi:hypothetical protein
MSRREQNLMARVCATLVGCRREESAVRAVEGCRCALHRVGRFGVEVVAVAVRRVLGTPLAVGEVRQWVVVLA